MRGTLDEITAAFGLLSQDESEKRFMAVNDVSRFDFSLALHGENVDYRKVSNILGVEIDRCSIRAPILAKNDQRKELFYGEIAWLLDLIEPKYDQLKDAGVDFKDSEIWMTYFYFAQCNMEFDSVLLERMGRLGLKLCVSCYQDDDLEVQENFPSEVGRMGEGISVNVSLSPEIKLNSTFDLIINVENNRKSRPFILTDFEIEEFYMEGFLLKEILPTPKLLHKANDYKIFRYDSMIPPNNSREFIIRLKAILNRVFRGDIKVMEGSQYLNVQMTTVVL